MDENLNIQLDFQQVGAAELAQILERLSTQFEQLERRFQQAPQGAQRVRQSNQVLQRSYSELTTELRNRNQLFERGNALLRSSASNTNLDAQSQRRLVASVRENRIERDRLARALSSVNGLTSRQNVLQAQAASQGANLISTIRGQRVELQRLQVAYRNNQTAANALAVQNVSQSLRRNETAARALGLQLDRTSRSAGFLTRTFQRLGVLVGVGQFIQGVRNAITSFVNFDQGLIAVQKTTGLSAEETTDLGERFDEMSTRVGVATQSLLDIAQVAGRTGLGEQGVDAVDVFTEGVARSTVALDEYNGNAEQLSEDLAIGLQLFDLSATEVENYASSLNVLSNNTASNVLQLSEFNFQFGGIARQFGISADAASAFGATLIELGADPSAAGTQLNAVLTRMATNSEEIAAALGVTRESLVETFDNDAQAGLQLVIEQLATIESNTERVNVVTELFGRVGARSFGRLATDQGISRLNRALELSSVGFETGTSVGTEFRIANESLASQIQITSNVFDQFRREALEDTNGAMRGLLSIVRSLLQSDGGVAGLIGVITAVVSGFSLWATGAAIAATATTALASAGTLLLGGVGLLIGVITVASAAYDALTTTVEEANASFRTQRAELDDTVQRHRETAGQIATIQADLTSQLTDENKTRLESGELTLEDLLEAERRNADGTIENSEQRIARIFGVESSASAQAINAKEIELRQLGLLDDNYRQLIINNRNLLINANRALLASIGEEVEDARSDLEGGFSFFAPGFFDVGLRDQLESIDDTIERLEDQGATEERLSSLRQARREVESDLLTAERTIIQGNIKLNEEAAEGVLISNEAEIGVVTRLTSAQNELRDIRALEGDATDDQKARAAALTIELQNQDVALERNRQVIEDSVNSTDRDAVAIGALIQAKINEGQVTVVNQRLLEEENEAKRAAGDLNIDGITNEEDLAEAKRASAAASRAAAAAAREAARADRAAAEDLEPIVEAYEDIVEAQEDAIESARRFADEIQESIRGVNLDIGEAARDDVTELVEFIADQQEEQAENRQRIERESAQESTNRRRQTIEDLRSENTEIEAEILRARTRLGEITGGDSDLAQFRSTVEAETAESEAQALIRAQNERRIELENRRTILNTNTIEELEALENIRSRKNIDLRDEIIAEIQAQDNEQRRILQLQSQLTGVRIADLGELKDVELQNIQEVFDEAEIRGEQRLEQLRNIIILQNQIASNNSSSNGASVPTRHTGGMMNIQSSAHAELTRSMGGNPSREALYMGLHDEVVLNPFQTKMYKQGIIPGAAGNKTVSTGDIHFHNHTETADVSRVIKNDIINLF